MTATIYGIPNCDTMKKARNWLSDNTIDFTFHNYKKEGIDAPTLQRWCTLTDFTTLLNKRGTTWRKLSSEQQADVNQQKAIALMIENPSLIKRPVLERDGQLLVGFHESDWQSLL